MKPGAVPDLTSLPVISSSPCQHGKQISNDDDDNDRSYHELRSMTKDDRLVSSVQEHIIYFETIRRVLSNDRNI